MVVFLIQYLTLQQELILLLLATQSQAVLEANQLVVNEPLQIQTIITTNPESCVPEVMGQ